MPLFLLGLATLGNSLSMSVKTSVNLTDFSTDYFSPTGENDPCTNPAGKSGRCIFFRSCESIMSIYGRQVVTPEESTFVDQSRCGKRADGKPLVSSIVSYWKDVHRRVRNVKRNQDS